MKGISKSFQIDVLRNFPHTPSQQNNRQRPLGVNIDSTMGNFGDQSFAGGSKCEPDLTHLIFKKTPKRRGKFSQEDLPIDFQ